MTKIKRKVIDDSEILSEGLTKKIKTSYVEIDDSNALILTKKKAIPKENKTVQEPVKVLSKKQRKELEKIIKKKEQKTSMADVYAELAAFNNLKPETAIKSLKEDLKNQPITTRKNLCEKVKNVSNKKLKAWEKKKNKIFVEKPQISSPDTSDFSSGEEEDEQMPDVVVDEPMDVSQVTEDKSKESLAVEIKKEKVPIQKDEKPKTILKHMPISFVLVNRPADVQESRMELPIIKEEAAIMEAITENDVVILSGATGCGKTTQVPQFLYEAGYTKNGRKIGVTEPRRVAAMSMSKRVAYELACQNNNIVSYHIRYEKNATCSTQIKFMTDGVLLQEIKQDVLLHAYSAIIIDEAHERSVYSDMLIALLSVIVRARRRDYEKMEDSKNETKNAPCPLKLIIMSATLRVSDFSENIRLFPGINRPPVIELPARQHPVAVKFSEFTHKKYLEEAFKKVVEIHEKYPEGGILIFVTGQQEILTLCKWLKKAFPVSEKFLNKIKNQDKVEKPKKSTVKTDELIKVNLTDFSIIPMDEESEITQVDHTFIDSDIEDDEDGMGAGEETREDIESIIGGAYSNISLENPVHVLPLYSLLPIDQQELVFKDPPPGQRLIVVATNVAETSLTIPGIKYVVDTGMEKIRKWDPITGISRFDIDRISQSSAEQRAGRAGRTGPGYCFRIYNSAAFENMKKFSDPEIITRPIEDVVLMVRKYIPSSIPIHKFCLPTAPLDIAIERAERTLLSMGALRRVKNSKSATEITDIGLCMSLIPLHPRFSRMLLLANQHGLLPYAVMMVSVLSVSNFFINSQTNESTADNQSDKDNRAFDFKRKFVQKRPDLMFGDISVLLGSVCALEKVLAELKDEDQARLVAETHGVRWQAFKEVRKLRNQLTNILNLNIKNLDLQISSYLPRPTNIQFEHLRQLVLSGSASNVARLAPVNVSFVKDMKQRRKEKGMYLSASLDKPVFIHNQSVLHRERYEWVVFQDLYKSSVHGQEDPKPFMRNVSVIEPEWLPIFCTLECKVEGLMLNHLCDNDAKHLPVYDENHDCIMACAKKIFFGQRNLLLPAGLRIPAVTAILEDEIVQAEKIRRWFAKFFVEGVIFKDMEAWRVKFKSVCKPDLILNPIGNQRPEVKSLMKDIGALDTLSRKAICDKWKEDKDYLKASYLAWIVPDEHEFIATRWPPVDSK